MPELDNGGLRVPATAQQDVKDAAQVNRLKILWRNIRTMPTQTVVLVKTVRGIVCPATTYPIHGETPWIKRPSSHRPYHSVDCYRLHRGKRGFKTVGDVRAIAWMPLPSRSFRTKARA